MPRYASFGALHVRSSDPVNGVLEAFRLGGDEYTLVATVEGAR